MKRWLNWREIEKMNVWGIRRKDSAEALSWDKSAALWEMRTRQEGEAGARQVSRMAQLRPEDTVLDVGCGVGTLTLPAARNVKTVYALDSSPRMLEILMEQAKEQGIGNIVPVLGNWYDLKPGTDYPICDVAMARHAPCQNDIIAFGRRAKRYCYSLWNVAPLQPEDYHDNPGVLSDPAINPNRVYNEPNGRLFGFNVHFNLLYDAGANPEVQYDTEIQEYEGSTYEEIVRKAFPGMEDISKIPPEIRRGMESGTVKTENGFLWKRVQRVSILGWNPGEIRWEADGAGQG